MNCRKWSKGYKGYQKETRFKIYERKTKNLTRTRMQFVSGRKLPMDKFTYGEASYPRKPRRIREVT